MEHFYVINEDWNTSSFLPYDVIPYLVRRYKETSPKNNRPVTLEDFVKFVNNESMSQWWGRCEYEIILKNWCGKAHEKKIDVYQQVRMNLNLIARIVMKEVTKGAKS